MAVGFLRMNGRFVKSGAGKGGKEGLRDMQFKEAQRAKERQAALEKRERLLKLQKEIADKQAANERNKRNGNAP